MSLRYRSLRPAPVVQINGQPLNLKVNETQTFMGNYYADITNVLLPAGAAHGDAARCGSESSPTQVTTTATSATTLSP